MMMGELLRSVCLLKFFILFLFTVNLHSNEGLLINELCEERIGGTELYCSKNLGKNEIVTFQKFNENTNIIAIRVTELTLITMPRNVFCYAQNTQQIKLSGNNINYLDTDSFDCGEQLTYVELENNNLRRIENGTFKINTEIKDLIIIESQLESIDIGAFRNLNKLKNLIINVPNVNLMHEEYFRDMIELKYLTLRISMTSIFDGAVFINNRNLTELVLSNNGIESVANRSLESLTKLRLLDLSHNNLGPEFDVSTLGSIEALEHLKLDGNNLKKFNYKVLRDLFPGLRYLDLQFNSFSQLYGMKVTTYFKIYWPSLVVKYGIFMPHLV